jgi:diguanylate cyclase (GGDEF)-like protein
MRGAIEPLDVLIEVTERFTQEAPLEEVLADVTAALLELVPGNHSSIRIFNDTRTELVCGARCGAGTSSVAVKFMKGEGIVGWVADYGRVARIGDVEQDGRFAPKNWQGFSFRSIMAVPLSLGSEVIGVLAVTAEAADAFTAEHETLARLLANCSVPVIQRNRLERLGLFDDVTQALRASRLLPQAEEELARAGEAGSPLSVIMLHLDQLQSVYQEYGFLAGDGVLRGFTERVRGLNKNEWPLFTRGGGTFVLVMPAIEQAEARNHAIVIRQDLESRPVDAGEGVAIPMSACFGLSTWIPLESADQLLRRTEAALMRARESGPGNIVTA